MNQLFGLMRDTWWLWLLFLVGVILAMLLLTPFYVVGLPFLLVVMFYFAFMRYDKSGNYRGESDRRDT